LSSAASDVYKRQPLVLLCLRESGVYAFFTRSSAANIPVNMALCEKLNLDRDTYSVSIPPVSYTHLTLPTRVAV
ncbi:hypothetical protein KQJ25_40620, partial [Escherichia sp. S69_ASV_4]|nr:hypothetical protein [Escherichia sp. S69_ASV_4]